MDSAILNSHEQLNGCALLYGPAVLKVYTLMFGARHIPRSDGPTTVAIVPSVDPDAEVWGVIYRIPGRLAKHAGKQPSLRNTLHTPQRPPTSSHAVQLIF